MFFKMNKRINHVGVYVGNNKFVHAGRTTGVTISEYDNYWSRRYWQTRRFI
ncbi:C40 family peptidase [Cetobacterium sp.]|uniref:C40 family peptidase n=1 Tax=Cetobacterium sp. TaxID=2071632 RepID=UPI003FA54680